MCIDEMLQSFPGRCSWLVNGSLAAHQCKEVSLGPTNDFVLLLKIKDLSYVEFTHALEASLLYRLKVWMLCDCGNSSATVSRIVAKRHTRKGPRGQSCKGPMPNNSRLHNECYIDNFFTGFDLAQFQLRQKLNLLDTGRKS
jgi:hypothetical protein